MNMFDNNSNKEIECYDWMYTKDIHKKAKVWNDGLMVHNKKENKVSLVNFAKFYK